MWFGWISCNRREGKFLRSLGIKLGPYDRTMELYPDCILSDEAKAAIEREQQGAAEALEPPRFIHLLNHYEESEA